MRALKAKTWDLPVFPAKTPKRKSDPEMKKAFGKLTKNLYERIQEHREDEWRKRILAFEANPDSVYNAYWYVALHPMFYYFKPWKFTKKDKIPPVHERHLVNEQGWDCVHISPQMVNPADMRISNDEHLNTQVDFWYEFGPTLWGNNYGEGIRGHDHTCDGGAPTYDEAIIKVAKAIHKTYGNDRKQVVKKWKDPELPTEG